jgi:hypothetical protein
MNARAKIFGIVAGTLIAVAAVAGILIKTQRNAHVRETLAILPKAEESYAGGRFDEAATTAGGALIGYEVHPVVQPEER